MSELIPVNDSNFESFLSEQKALIVDFWAPTCAPCKTIETGLEKIASLYKNEVKILKVNVNECPQTSSRFLVRSLPTILFIKDKNVKSQIIGAVNPKQIEEKLHEVI